VTLGIDLASQPRRTAACRVVWTDGNGIVELVRDAKLTDATLLDLIRDSRVRRVGIDAPFGWPIGFVNALVDYRDRGTWPDDPGETTAQKSMVLRATDREVWHTVKRKPLSVSTDLIAFAAMRCARLLAAIAAAGEPLQRGGDGRIIEVYPEAALRCWGLSPALTSEDPGGYKGKSGASRARRSRLVDSLLEQTRGWLTVDSSAVQIMRDSDDQLDALLCALIARAADLGRLQPVGDPASAATEGWIRLPLCGPLSALGA
jgi:predicted RNase H-like nuclease